MTKKPSMQIALTAEQQEQVKESTRNTGGYAEEFRRPTGTQNGEQPGWTSTMTTRDRSENLKLFMDGKFKKLNLLFTVNGGAFAIVKLFKGASLAPGAPLVGRLTVQHLAYGAIVFTIVMILDAFCWGVATSWGFPEASGKSRAREEAKVSRARWICQFVLVALCGIICLAWWYAGRGS